MTPAIYAVLGLVVAFFLFIIVGLFLYLAIRAISVIQEFRRSVDAAAKALETIAPLLKGEELTRLSNAFVLMGKQGASILQMMEALDKTIRLFYSFAVANAETTGAVRTSTPAGSGRFVGYSDDRAAANEAAVVAQEQAG